MSKDRAKTKNKTASPFKVALLLVQFILIKVGQIPLFIVYCLLFIVRKILSFRFPNFSLPRLWRSRGRPRKSWFIPFYLNKLNLHIKRRIPKKTKIAVAAGLILLVVYIYTSFIFTAAYQLPSPERLTQSDKGLTTEFFDRNGILLYRLYEGRNRILVKLEEIPQFLIQATIAVEDRNFYKHPGIDPLAIARAIRSNLKKQVEDDGTHLEGASTITQQLIKNTLLTPEKTYSRKIKEMILALWAERTYTKAQILQMYFNEAPYGGPIWGIKAAAQTYFAKDVKDLSLAQAAFLAGLPVSPTQFSPYGSNPQLGKLRQKAVLGKMVENQYITPSQADAAFKEDLGLQPAINNIKAPHFVMHVKDWLSQKYGQRAVSQGGLKIVTTLDLNIQQTVEKMVAEEVSKLAPLNVQNGAAMVTDAKTGQILAMVGSKNYHEPNFGSFNVTLALRQPGSSIKVTTYATAFKQGFSPGNTVLDVPVTFRDEWGNSYSPVNYDGAYHGAVSIRTALGSSYNVPAVRLLAMLSVPAVINTAKDLGITTFTDPKKYGLSLTLGGAAVKMVDMMTMYQALSQLGSKIEATPILKVVDSTGNVLEEYEPRPTQAISPEIAYLITDILSDNNARTPAFGANSQLIIAGHTVAVKTGTSDNKRDNWTFGYTPDYVVGVWVGNPNNSPMNPTLTSGVTGAAPIWHKIMTSLLAGKEDQAFARPSGIVEVRVDGRRDLAISNMLPKSLVRVAQKDNQTIFSDPYSFFATPSASFGKAQDKSLGASPSAQQKQAGQPAFLP